MSATGASLASHGAAAGAPHGAAAGAPHGAASGTPHGAASGTPVDASPWAVCFRAAAGRAPSADDLTAQAAEILLRGQGKDIAQCHIPLLLVRLNRFLLTGSMLASMQV